MLYRAILILLGVLLAACAAPPGPNPTATVSAGPSATPTRSISPLATATPGQVVVLPRATVTVASPLAAPTRVSLPTATRPSDTPTLSPSPTALIVPVTPTRLQVISTETRASALLAPTVVLGATPTHAPVSPPPTVIPRPTSTRAPTPTPAPTVAPILVTAWVSNPDPQPGMDVTVYGRLLINGEPVANEGMVAHWHFKGRYVDCVADTGPDGVASCSVNTYGLPARFTVDIEVFISHNQAPYRATTQLTIDD